MLTLEHISKTYPDGTQALNDITIELPSGMVGLLGPNGAGKTTLIHAAAHSSSRTQAIWRRRRDASPRIALQPARPGRSPASPLPLPCPAGRAQAQPLGALPSLGPPARPAGAAGSDGPRATHTARLGHPPPRDGRRVVWLLRPRVRRRVHSGGHGCAG